MSKHTNGNPPVINDESMSRTLASLSAESRAHVFLLAHRLRELEQEARRAAVLRKLANESREGIIEFGEAPDEAGVVTFEFDRDELTVSDTLPPPQRPKPPPPPAKRARRKK